MKINLGAHFLLLTFFEIFNFKSTLFTKIMPIFRSLDLEQMLIYQKVFFYEKVLFFTQLSYHLMCKLLKKSYMLSTTYVVSYTFLWIQSKLELLRIINSNFMCLWPSDRPNVQFGRTVLPNFYCLVRPKWQNLFLQNTELFFFTIHCIFQNGYPRYFKLGLCKQCYRVISVLTK